MDSDRSHEELVAEYSLGKNSEEFIESELGRYIIGRVDQERSDAVEKLINTPSWRWITIRELRNEIWRCDTFKGWLADCVIRGKQALELLDQDAA